MLLRKLDAISRDYDPPPGALITPNEGVVKVDELIALQQRLVPTAFPKDYEHRINSLTPNDLVRLGAIGLEPLAVRVVRPAVKGGNSFVVRPAYGAREEVEIPLGVFEVLISPRNHPGYTAYLVSNVNVHRVE